MKLKKTLSLVLGAALSLSMLAACGGNNGGSTSPQTQAPQNQTTAAKLSGTVSTDGSTSMEKVIGSLGEAFMEANDGVEVTYNATGSGTGITAVSEGRCDIGLASRNLKDSETGLTATVVALDGIAIVVNTGSAVEDLTLEQIADIFTGKITNWSEVGGADGEIVCIGREAGSGTRDGFESITGTSESCVYRQELTSTGDVIATVSSNPNAIGYASLSAVNDTVKAVTVGGVAPSEATVLDGTYAIQRPFNLITREGEALSEVAQAFFDYATSTAANDLIVAAGAVPVAQ